MSSGFVILCRLVINATFCGANFVIFDVSVADIFEPTFVEGKTSENCNSHLWTFAMQRKRVASRHGKLDRFVADKRVEIRLAENEFVIQ